MGYVNNCHFISTGNGDQKKLALVFPAIIRAMLK